MNEPLLHSGDLVTCPYPCGAYDITGCYPSGDAVSSTLNHNMIKPPDPDDRIDDDPNLCSVCGGPIANGVRLMHEYGGPLCLSCARVVMPEQVEIAEAMWRQLADEEPSNE